jgi:hypothetical protein
MQDIDDDLERASTPRRSHAHEYTGPVNALGQPDTTGGQEIGTKIYRSDPVYKKYTGQWQNGEFEGMGTVEFAHGDTYKGHFSDGMLHGVGRYVFKNGLILEGEFSFDKIKKGKQTAPNGNTFEGEYFNGRPDHGVTSANGDVFEGFYYPNGSSVGKDTWANGIVCTGEFKDGILHGFGRVSVPGPGGHEYEGQFVNGKMHGKGKLFFRDGRVYVGTFKNDVMHKGKFLTGVVADDDSGTDNVDGGNRRRTCVKTKRCNRRDFKAKRMITAKR